MAEPPKPLAGARILLSNDDGIHAKGLTALERIACALSDDVWVVAPETEQSAASHSLTILRPLRIHRYEERRYAVDGTPTDCVMLAVRQVLADHPPDLVLSGVNRGGNLGEDVTYSGTIAAAMEGTLLGIPSIALSLMVPHDGRAKWATAEHFAPTVIARLVAAGWPRDVFMNVNFPNLAVGAVKGVAVARQGYRKIAGQFLEGRDPRGKPYYWIDTVRDEDRGRTGTDLAAVHEGIVSVTPFHMDLTHEPTVTRLKDLFA